MGLDVVDVVHVLKTDMRIGMLRVAAIQQGDGEEWMTFETICFLDKCLRTYVEEDRAWKCDNHQILLLTQCIDRMGWSITQQRTPLWTIANTRAQ